IDGAFLENASRLQYGKGRERVRALSNKNELKQKDAAAHSAAASRLSNTRSNLRDHTRVGSTRKATITSARLTASTTRTGRSRNPCRDSVGLSSGLSSCPLRMMNLFCLKASRCQRRKPRSGSPRELAKELDFLGKMLCLEPRTVTGAIGRGGT